jgi:hypothetical protein
MNDNTSSTSIVRLVLGALLLASSSACSSDELPLRNIGDTSNGLALGSPVTTTTVLTGNARFEGRWVGQTRDPLVRDAAGNPMDYAFPSGSRQVVLELALQGDVLAGSITFGAGSLPQAEAGVSYPPGVDYGLLPSDVFLGPMEGLAYRLSDETPPNPETAPADAVLTFPRFAGFATWCPLQPSLPWQNADFRGPGFYTCVAEVDSWGGTVVPDGNPHCSVLTPGSTEQQAVDCNYYSLCLGHGPCACSADGCTVDETISNHIYLDLIDGEIKATFSDTQVDGGRLGDIRFQHVGK